MEIGDGEMIRWLTRMEATLDRIANDHETRLRRTERVMYVAMGLALAGGISGGASLLSAAGGA